MKAKNGYKENLLQNAKYQMALAGGKVSLRGTGVNRHVIFNTPDGRKLVVWYPTESRVRDLEITDMKEAILECTGHAAFTMGRSK